QKRAVRLGVGTAVLATSWLAVGFALLGFVALAIPQSRGSLVQVIPAQRHGLPFAVANPSTYSTRDVPLASTTSARRVVRANPVTERAARGKQPERHTTPPLGRCDTLRESNRLELCT